MLILAIEQSSDLGSIALLNDEKIIVEKGWNTLSERSGGLFVTLKKLLAEFSAPMDDITTYAIDVGPGSYSGLRAALAAARGLALPDNKPIYALTSAETLAFEIMRENSAPLVQVVGDARRGQWWTGIYKKSGARPIVQADIHLVSEKDFRPAAGAVVVSPDWHRLGEQLKFSVAGQARLIEKPCVPKASQLGRLAGRKISQQAPSEPLKIIYLHAAVNPKP